MLLCTGSQGEPRAAIARIAEDQHPHISLEPGDLVIFSSKTIPGNEKDVSRVHNNLAQARRRYRSPPMRRWSTPRAIRARANSSSSTNG